MASMTFEGNMLIIQGLSQFWVEAFEIYLLWECFQDVHMDTYPGVCWMYSPFCDFQVIEKFPNGVSYSF